MIIMNKLLYIILTFIKICSSFDYKHGYLMKLSRPSYTFYNHNFNKPHIAIIKKWIDNTYQIVDYKYQFSIYNGLVSGNAIQCINPHLTNNINRTLYKYEVNFIYNHTRSIIDIVYEKDVNNRLKLKMYNMTGLHNHKELDPKHVNSIVAFINKVSKWKGRFQTIRPYMKYYNRKIYDVDSYDFCYFFLDTQEKKRICHLSLDNLILSIPEAIEEYKPYSFIFGCLVRTNLYIQVNINYNYNGIITSIDLYEYKPNIKMLSNLMLLQLLKQLFPYK